MVVVTTKFTGRKSCPCHRILKNKCCIVCLIFLTFFISAIIAAKLFIDSVLNEVEADSFGISSAHGGQDGTSSVESRTNRSLKFFETWEPPEDIRKEFVHTFAGFDYFNRPVWIMPVGQWDIKGMLNAKEGNEEAMKLFSEKCLHRILASLKIRNSTQSVLISNMDGFAYSQLASIITVKYILQMTKKYEPLVHNLAYGFTINLDYFASAIVTMVRPILGSSMDKIEIFGSNRDKYVPALLKKIPADQLPPSLGGSKHWRPVAVYD